MSDAQLTRTGQARLVEGGGGGLASWLLQRATAVLMAVGLPAFALYVLLALEPGYLGWKALFAPLAVRIGVLLLFLGLLLHAWIGLRDVIMDYVPGLVPRFALYTLLLTAFAGQGVWLVHILWGS
ncbi:MAG: succinate dehydrogenase, hydrophobic membrane anchor protein [Thiobacillaceae bacterium]|nr:succinate dehydrogenase, hydrophobic membrane anchor protein [Thiobacillaceae bacterium]MDW8323832.1 succinate dehydrogenase, hydrophobic membrane anchor protein [Burkholderiales bacterium]